MHSCYRGVAVGVVCCIDALLGVLWSLILLSLAEASSEVLGNKITAAVGLQLPASTSRVCCAGALYMHQDNPAASAARKQQAILLCNGR